MNNQINSIGVSSHDDLIILEDFNADLLLRSPAKVKLENFRKCQNLDQLISVPTRITCTSATLLDHIFVNDPQLYCHQGVINPDLSDHSLTYTSRKKGKISKETEFRIIRCYRHFVPENLAANVKLTDWLPVFASMDVNDAVGAFQELF